MDRESRLYAGKFEVRKAEDGAATIRGYAAVFNELSENLGGFREEIKPGAFANVLEDDVRAFFNHDENLILGRTAADTLKLTEDAVGLAYDIQLPDTQAARDLVVSIERGDVNQSSFSFNVARGGDIWAEDDESGAIVRTITEIARLWDVSPVSIPAYPQTSVAKRSLEAYRAEKSQPVHMQLFRARARVAAII